MQGRFALLALTLLVTTAACGGSGASSAVRPHAPTSERAIRTPRSAEPPPRLIAPPPAYGNKIVMAQGDADEAVN